MIVPTSVNANRAFDLTDGKLDLATVRNASFSQAAITGGISTSGSNASVSETAALVFGTFYVRPRDMPPSGIYESRPYVRTSGKLLGGTYSSDGFFIFRTRPSVRVWVAVRQRVYRGRPVPRRYEAGRWREKTLIDIDRKTWTARYASPTTIDVPPLQIDVRGASRLFIVVDVRVRYHMMVNAYAWFDPFREGDPFTLRFPRYPLERV